MNSNENPSIESLPREGPKSQEPTLEQTDDRPRRIPDRDAAAEVYEKAIEILRRDFPRAPAAPAETEGRSRQDTQLCSSTDTAQAPPTTTLRRSPAGLPEIIPARMLNEFVYCPRLFYYEHVEGVFVESADTRRGAAQHARVDAGTGALPKPDEKAKVKHDQGADARGTANLPPSPSPDTIHSRSVQMGSDRLSVTAKMDLVEVCKQGADSPQGETGDLFDRLMVCPVDYKAGAPKPGEEANELWDTDRMQLGLQVLILRDNGYTCNAGIIYYRATKQRVRLEVTAELESWILGNIEAARLAANLPIPPPLVNSPKCVRCSLAPVCLPDETRMLARVADLNSTESNVRMQKSDAPLRRLIAARDDSRTLYLNTPGLRVGCKDEVLQVKEEKKVVDEVRMRDLSHVALFGNIQITTQAVQTLCEREVPVTYFSMGGWFYGITRGHGLKNIFLRIEQFRVARDPAACLALARQFVHGKIRNQRTLLMRNHVEAPTPVLLKLKRAAEDALGASSLESLLGIEGAAAALFFGEFNGMIKLGPDEGDTRTELGSDGPPPLTLQFANRNRRPPTDPVNAMLSLSYSLLTKDCTLAALAVGFDPYLGFYHQPRFGRPALALDLVEEFRPLIADSTVLSCINNRVLTDRDFVRAGHAVNLGPAGRKRFFQMYEQRMNSLITHPLFDYKVSYRRALELQARILAKTLTSEIGIYVPMLTR
jgi:CRISP-associated protein Cas1